MPCDGRLGVSAVEYFDNPIIEISCERCEWTPDHYGSVSLDRLLAYQAAHDARVTLGTAPQA